MLRYRFHFLDRLNVVVLVREYEHEDDLSALAQAEEFASTHTIELWQDDRRVAFIKRGRVPASVGDRLAG